MSKKLYEESNVSAIADAIREKNSSTTTYKISEMAQAIKDLPSGGGDSAVDSLIDGSITEISTDVSTIRQYAFRGCSLVSVVLPNITTVVQEAFGDCVSLMSVSLPKVTSTSYNSFRRCLALTTMSLPKLTTLGQDTFYYCEGLISVDFPNLTTIKSGGFECCTALEEVSFPLLTSMGSGVFYGCTKLKTVSLPQVTSLASNSFYECKSLTKIEVPKVWNVQQTAFYLCSTLETIDFPVNNSMASIYAYAFQKCYKLTNLILRSSTKWGLSNVNAFSDTPIASGTGYIYVPDDLVDSYKSATNWSTYSDQIKPLSEYVE